MATDPTAPDEAAQGSIVADRDGVIRLWGLEWENLLGYTSSEARGRKVDLIIPPALQGFHWRGFNKALTTGRLRRPGKTLKIPAVHKDGAIIPIRASLAITPTDEGTVQGFTATLLGRGPAW